MNTVIKYLLIMIAQVAFASSAVANEKFDIKNDPFKRPDHILKTSSSKQHPSGKTTTKSKLILKAILQSNNDANDSMANINGNMLKIGESIEGYRLIRIDAKKAILKRKGKKITLFLE